MPEYCRNCNNCETRKGTSAKVYWCKKHKARVLPAAGRCKDYRSK